jgi:hypothetical protein
MQNFPSNGQSAARCDIIVGTRPEAIKLAPVIKALRESGDDFKVRVVTSGQHGEICRSALAAFGLTADSELDIEPITGSLADAAGNLLRAFGRRFADTRPDLILVQGDTTTAMTAALAGFYAQVPVVHVEAGLRSGDLAHPFPEEANRQIIDAVSDILLPPTPRANGFFTAASERRLYFTGLLSGQPINYAQVAGQYMPYTVHDVYKMKVLADTLGGIEPQPYFSYPARLPADIIADAQRNLVVRDAWASFFFHTYDNVSYLKQTVLGLKSLGYTFVSPTAA